VNIFCDENWSQLHSVWGELLLPPSPPRLHPQSPILLTFLHTLPIHIMLPTPPPAPVPALSSLPLLKPLHPAPPPPPLSVYV
jgi:hypothetical protein